jgi:hypothetical protein
MLLNRSVLNTFSILLLLPIVSMIGLELGLVRCRLRLGLRLGLGLGLGLGFKNSECFGSRSVLKILHRELLFTSSSSQLLHN